MVWSAEQVAELERLGFKHAFQRQFGGGTGHADVAWSATQYVGTTDGVAGRAWLYWMPNDGARVACDTLQPGEVVTFPDPVSAAVWVLMQGWPEVKRSSPAEDVHQALKKRFMG